MKKKVSFILLFVFLLPSIIFAVDFADRGRYIYDEVNRLPVESKLALSAYLWQIDAKTDYEVVVVFPAQKMSEQAIIGAFNNLGIGKKDKNNGTAIFIFPDNSVFTAIGSGNSKVSVDYVKTVGGNIFEGLAKDPVLTILRFANALKIKISEPTVWERSMRAGEFIKENFDIILLWTLFLSLAVLLFKQQDGFQSGDFIIPVLLMIVAGTVIACGYINPVGNYVSHEYGAIVQSNCSKRHYVTTHYVKVGKTSIPVHTPHTDYINETICKSYNLKQYNYRFRTTDNKGAWDHYPVGGPIYMDIKSNNLISAGQVSDMSGGKSSGAGVWIAQKFKE